MVCRVVLDTDTKYCEKPNEVTEFAVTLPMVGMYIILD